MQLHINGIYTAVYTLQEDIDTLYEYMRVLSTQQLNPLIYALLRLGTGQRWNPI